MEVDPQSSNLCCSRSTLYKQKLVKLKTETAAAAAAKSLQSCPTLCDPRDSSPTRLPRPWDSQGKNTGIGCHFLLQFMKVKVKSFSCVRLFTTPWTAAYQAVPSMGFSRQEYWGGVPLPSSLGSRAQAQYLWCMGLAAPWHVGSTWISD